MFRFALACVVTMGVSPVAGAQDRPSLSGSWTLVADRGTPAGNMGAFGEAFKIAQQATAIDIETTATVMRVAVQPGGEVSPGVRTPLSRTESYTTDGVEHEMPAPQGPPGGQMMVLSKRIYRATWTTGQLVLITYNKAAATRGTDIEGQITSVVRTAFSLDPDGSLVVDRTVIAMPKPNGPRQEPPVSTRSVYKKAQ